MPKKKNPKSLSPDKKRPARTWTIAELPSQSAPDERPESLCPTAGTMWRYLRGEATARAIITAWQPTFRVVHRRAA